MGLIVGDFVIANKSNYVLDKMIFKLHLSGVLFPLKIETLQSDQ